MSQWLCAVCMVPRRGVVHTGRTTDWPSLPVHCWWVCCIWLVMWLHSMSCDLVYKVMWLHSMSCDPVYKVMWSTPCHVIWSIKSCDFTPCHVTSLCIWCIGLFLTSFCLSLCTDSCLSHRTWSDCGSAVGCSWNTSFCRCTATDPIASATPVSYGF